MVLMPNSQHAGISLRIESEKERERLKNIVSPYCDEEQGFIVRTAGEGATELDLQHDAEFLRRVWKKVLARKQRKQTKLPLYQDLSLSFRMLRDFVGRDLERIRIDSNLTHQELESFTQEFVPELTPLLEYYPGELPIFDFFSVEN